MKKKIKKILVFAMVLFLLAGTLVNDIGITGNAAESGWYLSLSPAVSPFKVPAIDRDKKVFSFTMSKNGTSYKVFCMNPSKHACTGDTAALTETSASSYKKKKIAKAMTYWYSEKGMNQSNDKKDFVLIQTYIWAVCRTKKTNINNAIYQAGQIVRGKNFSKDKAKKLVSAIDNTRPVGTILLFNVKNCKTGKKRSDHQPFVGYKYDVELETGTLSDSKSERHTITTGLSVIKQDSITKTPLAGAEFALLKDGKQVTKAVSGKDGKAVFDYNWDVSYSASEKGYVYVKNWDDLSDEVQEECTKNGWYKDKAAAKKALAKALSKKLADQKKKEDAKKHKWEIKEVKAPEGYTVSTQVLSATLAASDTKKTFTLTDQQQFYGINIKKSPSGGSQKGTLASLAGAEYEVRAAEHISAGGKVYEKDALVGTAVTDEDGNASISGLPSGKYAVTEIKAPEGWMIDKTTHYVELPGGGVDASFNASVESLEDEKENRIVIDKTYGPGETGDPEPGAEFSIYAIKADGNAESTPSDVMVTNAAGHAESKLLPYGHYVMKQTKGLAGYFKSPDIEVFIEKDESQQPKGYTYQLHNRSESQRIEIMKKFAVSDKDAKVHYKEPEYGAVFNVYKKADYAANGEKAKEVDTIKTDRTGFGCTGDLENGTYTVHQVEGRSQAKFVKDFDVQIGGPKRYLYELENPYENPKLMIEKVLEKNGKQTPEKNAEFYVLKVSELKNGMPDKKALATAESRKVFIDKVPEAVEATLLTGDDGKAAAVFPETDMDDKGLLVLQTKGAEGYSLADPYYTKDHTPEIKDGEGGTKIPLYKFKAVDQFDDWAKVRLFKGYVTGRAGNSIQQVPEKNAVFKIYDSQGHLVDTLTTDSKGAAMSIALDFGNYVLKQTGGSANHNYINDIMFSLTDNEKHKVLTLNKKKNNGNGFTVSDVPADPSAGMNDYEAILNEEKPVSFEISKTSSDTHIVLPGAVFDVYKGKDASGKRVATMITGTNGKASIELPFGEYCLVETTAPNGFQKPENGKPFTLDINSVNYNKTPSYSMALENEPVWGEIKVNKTGNILTGYDKDSDSFAYEKGPVAGVTFTLHAKEDILRDDGSIVWKAGTLIDTKTTGTSGIAQFSWVKNGKTTTDFYMGTYTVTETAAPEGFVIDTEPRTVVLTYDQTAGATNKTEPADPGDKDDRSDTAPEFNPQGRKGTLLQGRLFNAAVKNADASVQKIVFTYLDHQIYGNPVRYKYNIDVSDKQDRTAMMAVDERTHTAIIRTVYDDAQLYIHPDSEGMFAGLSSLQSIDFDNLNTEELKRATGMFEGDASLRMLDLSNFHTPELMHTDRMFYGCENLETVYVNDTRYQLVPGEETPAEPQPTGMRIAPKYDFLVGTEPAADDFYFYMDYSDGSSLKIADVYDNDVAFKPAEFDLPGDDVSVSAVMGGKYAAYGTLKTKVRVIDPEDSELEVEHVNHVDYVLDAYDNAQEAEVYAAKVEKGTNRPLNGAIFRLRANTDILNAKGAVIFRKDAVIRDIEHASVSSTAGGLAPMSLGILPSSAYAKDKTVPMYRVEELVPPPGYKRSTEVFYVNARPADQKAQSFAFTHTFEDEESETVGIRKYWRNVSEDKMPDYITINASKGLITKTFTLTRDNGWYTDTDIRKDDIENWTFKEVRIYPAPTEKVKAAIHPYDENDPYASGSVEITNYYPYEITIPLRVTKQWDDYNDAEGMRPLSVTVRLHQDGIPVETAVLNAANNWTYETAKTYKETDDTGRKIQYEWKEDPVPGYETESVSAPDDVDGIMTTTFTNHMDVKVRVSIEKKWDNPGSPFIPDNPKGAIVYLLRDGKQFRTVPLSEAYNGWKYESEELPKYDKTDGHAYSYTWEEKQSDLVGSPDSMGDTQFRPVFQTVAGYDSNGIRILRTTLTNYHRPRPGEVTVNKRVRAEDLDFMGGNPSFTFVLEGEDVLGNAVKQEKTLAFTPADKASLAADAEGFLTKNVKFTNIQYGTYRLYEKDPSGQRYYLDKVTCRGNAKTDKTENGEAEVIIEKTGYNAAIDGTLAYDKYTSWKAEAAFTNKKLRGSLRIVKKHLGFPISGVEFSIVRDEDGKEILRKETDAKGEVFLDALKPGAYTVTETKTRKGYSLLDGPFRVTIPVKVTANDAKTHNVDTSKGIYHAEDDSFWFYDLTYTVGNEASPDLPRTGGTGDMLIMAAAAAVLLTIGGCLYTRKKK